MSLLQSVHREGWRQSSTPLMIPKELSDRPTVTSQEPHQCWPSHSCSTPASLPLVTKHKANRSREEGEEKGWNRKGGGGRNCNGGMEMENSVYDVITEKCVGVSQMPSEKEDLSPWLPLFCMHKHWCSQRKGRLSLLTPLSTNDIRAACFLHLKSVSEFPTLQQNLQNIQQVGWLTAPCSLQPAGIQTPSLCS